MSAAASSMNQFFGRKYQLVLTLPQSGGSSKVLTITDSAWEPEALRITFDINTSLGPVTSVPWTAQISIYNLNEQFSDLILSQGSSSGSQPSASSQSQALPISQLMEVQLYAGYQTPGKYGLVWDGYVLQPLFERENQTDLKLTLNCINWLGFVSRNDIVAYFAAGIKQQDIVRQMAAQCFNKIGTATIVDLGPATLPRGEVMMGSPRKYLTEIARNSGYDWWLQQKGLLNYGPDTLPPVSSKPPLVYSSSSGIIGTPQQTQAGPTLGGVDMTILLDPEMQVSNPLITFKIDNTVIRQILKQVGVYPGLLSQDGTYIAARVRYVGDTRGQSWYCHVTGLNPAVVAQLNLDAATGVQHANG